MPRPAVVDLFAGQPMSCELPPRRPRRAGRVLQLTPSQRIKLYYAASRLVAARGDAICRSFSAFARAFADLKPSHRNSSSSGASASARACASAFTVCTALVFP